MARYVVLEKATMAQARALAAGLDACVVEGWDVPCGPGAVRVGEVTDLASAAQAVLAAVRGADLVVLAGGDRSVTDQLCDDLRRLGHLEHRVGPPAAVALSADERALLAHLVGGASLGDAARALHISRRTADRRLAAARRALGAVTTSEAVVLARRNGVTPA